MPDTPTIRQSLPPPWLVVEIAAGYKVVDSVGHDVAYVYGEDEPTRRSTGRYMTMAQAKAVATAIAKLPGIMP